MDSRSTVWYGPWSRADNKGTVRSMASPACFAGPCPAGPSPWHGGPWSMPGPCAWLRVTRIHIARTGTVRSGERPADQRGPFPLLALPT